jgi:hypothetical protein
MSSEHISRKDAIESSPKRATTSSSTSILAEEAHFLLLLFVFFDMLKDGTRPCRSKLTSCILVIGRAAPCWGADEDTNVDGWTEIKCKRLSAAFVDCFCCEEELEEEVLLMGCWGTDNSE